MLKVGLTGNRYSGKNTVSKLFKQITIPVFDADTCISFLINYNFEFNCKIHKRLSSSCFDKNGFIDPFHLSSREFIECLDIIEDELFTTFDKFCQRNIKSAYILFKCSIIFERKWQNKFDYNISVFTPVSYRMQRCKRITNVDIENLTNLFNTEIKDENKNSLSNYIIHNYDGAPDLLTQVNKVDTDLIDKYLDIAYRNPKKNSIYDCNL